MSGTDASLLLPEMCLAETRKDPTRRRIAPGPEVTLGVLASHFRGPRARRSVLVGSSLVS